MDDKVFIVDSHCHLDCLTDKTLDDVRAMASDSGVKHFLTISVEESNWEGLQKMAEAPILIVR